MDYTKYIQSINDDINNQNNQKLLSSNPNYHIEKHISHFNYDDKTKTNVLSKLKNIIDSTTAMKVFNYLVSNNLINEFLESYDYLTTLRIYNPLTYTQIINYVIDYKKTNTEMDDILEEEINFLLDTKVTKKSLQSLRKRTNNPNSVRILNKAIKNTPDKQSVKKMSIPVKQSLIEVLENRPTQVDFEAKEDEEEQIQSIANSVAETPDDFEEKADAEEKDMPDTNTDTNPDDFEEEFNAIEQEALTLGVTPEKNKSNEVIDLPDLEDIDEEDELVLVKGSIIEKLERKKREKRPPEVIAAEKAEKAKRAEERAKKAQEIAAEKAEKARLKEEKLKDEATMAEIKAQEADFIKNNPDYKKNPYQAKFHQDLKKAYDDIKNKYKKPKV